MRVTDGADHMALGSLAMALCLLAMECGKLIYRGRDDVNWPGVEVYRIQHPGGEESDDYVVFSDRGGSITAITTLPAGTEQDVIDYVKEAGDADSRSGDCSMGTAGRGDGVPADDGDGA